jgi:spermidine synthase
VKSDTALQAVETKTPAWLLLATIFVTGNVVMMIEVVGTRVVGPYFGVGLYVWSALITVTLLALAAGYWLGGQLADRRRQPEFLYFAILAAAVFTLVIPLWRFPLLAAMGQLGVKTGVLAGSAILFGPPLLLLGMVSPYATKLYTDQFEKLGRRVGLLYSISTLGSFLGTILMGFYLIPSFRLTTILLALGLVLLLLPLAFFLVKRRQGLALFAGLMILVVAGVFFYPQAPLAQPLASGMRIIDKRTSFYGEIKVLEKNSNRLLLVDGIIQSGESTGDENGFPPYVMDLDSLVRRFHPQAKSILLVGLGGGNLAKRFLTRGLQVDAVEIDPEMLAVAEKYFGLDAGQVHVTLDDGRHFVRHCPKKYDVIVLNTFTGENFPSHLLTQEFFREVNAKLNPGGITALNFVGYVQGPHREATQAVYATLKSDNTWCRLFFRGPKEQFANVLYLAGQGAVPGEPAGDATWTELQPLEVTFTEGLVCTDDYNPVEFMNRVVYRRWRQLMMESLGPEILLN